MEDYFFIILVLIFIVCVIVGDLSSKRKHRKRLKKNIEDLWGRKKDFWEQKYNFDRISSFYKGIVKNYEACFTVDDITWNDFDMDTVFKRIDHTMSSPGDEMLYKMLRIPCRNKEILEKRENIIDYFTKNKFERESIQYILGLYGKDDYVSVPDVLYFNLRPKTKNALKYKLLVLGLLLSPLILLINPQIGLLLIVGILITNITLYYRRKKEIDIYLDVLSKIAALKKYAKKLVKYSYGEIKPIIDEIYNAQNKIKGTAVNSFEALFFDSSDIFLQYVRVVFLGELIAFESFFNKIELYKKEFRTIYENIGMLDALLSVASLRAGLDKYSVPVFYENSNIKLKAEEIYHPLIENPVCNDIDMKNCMLITGSNASGKSTFLKTIGINTILAQTIHTCFAKNFKMPFFMVYSSMALKDSIKDNESYFMVEIKSLKRIIEAADKKEIKCLCIIDEVLKGTNTIERIAASTQILYKLKQIGCLCIAATHDIELTYILNEVFDNGHFKENFMDNDISFDYKLLEGRADSRNAIKLLKILGFDLKLIKNAEDRVIKFEESGLWEL